MVNNGRKEAFHREQKRRCLQLNSTIWKEIIEAQVRWIGLKKAMAP